MRPFVHQTHPLPTRDLLTGLFFWSEPPPFAPSYRHRYPQVRLCRYAAGSRRPLPAALPTRLPSVQIPEPASLRAGLRGPSRARWAFAGSGTGLPFSPHTPGPRKDATPPSRFPFTSKGNLIPFSPFLSRPGTGPVASTGLRSYP